MNRFFKHRRDPGLGRWLDDLAETLVREGTRGRRELESGGDAWVQDPILAGDEGPGTAPIEARIRAIFAGHLGLDGTAIPGGEQRTATADQGVASRSRRSAPMIEH